jgi:hypothetical protein
VLYAQQGSTRFTIVCCVLQDIHKPESARLRRHLSAVINFAKFREEKLVAYT